MTNGVLDFLRAGGVSRKLAKAISDDAVARVQAAKSRYRKADKETREALARHDQQRVALQGEIVAGVDATYALADLSSPATALPADSLRMRPPDFDSLKLPRVPSSFGAIVLGLACGAILGALASVGLDLIDLRDSTVATALVILGFATIGVMTGGMRSGKAVIAGALAQEETAAQFDADVSAYIKQLERVRIGVEMSMQLAAQLAERARAKKEELNSIATDTTNAAMLLRSVLDTALLNEEGALLDGVIEKLHGQKERIGAFGAALAHQC